MLGFLFLIKLTFLHLGYNEKVQAFPAIRAAKVGTGNQLGSYEKYIMQKDISKTRFLTQPLL